jgi:hypothetical protein
MTRRTRDSEPRTGDSPSNPEKPAMSEECIKAIEAVIVFIEC